MEPNLNKKLKSRHINMIAIGGSIGTGIFLSSGYAIYTAGGGGALLAYIIMAVVVYFLMTSLGELSTFKPSSGSFCDYSSEYVGKSWGFAMGYNYWFNWAITVAVEISAASLVMGYWFPGINPIWFSAAFFIGVLIANLFSVRVYGEVEYLLSLVKVAAIIVFIVLGLFMIFQQPHFGIGRWAAKDAIFHSGWFGFISVFLFAGFSFQGTELVGVASGETKDPEVAIPRAIKLVFWRLTLFYVLSIAVISLLISFNDPRLATQDSVKISPYTLVFSHYLGDYAATIINSVILIALISAANASMYSASRVLWHLGNTNQAPNFISKLSKRGLPIVAVLFTAIIGSFVFMSSLVGNGVLFTYLVQISSLCGFLAWFGISLSHYQFRRNFLPQLGGVGVLKYKARFFPWAQIISMLVILFVVCAQFTTLGKEHSMFDLIMIYSSVILFIVLYLSHKIYRGFSTKVK